MDPGPCLITKLCPAVCDSMDCNVPVFLVLHYFTLKFMSIESVMPSNYPSAAPFFRPQSFPKSGSFPMSQLFASSDLSFGASASSSVLPMNIQG